LIVGLKIISSGKMKNNFHEQGAFDCVSSVEKVGMGGNPVPLGKFDSIQTLLRG